jgi:septum formation protein
MGEPGPLRLILASASPARRSLLERAGYSFEVKPADIDEPTGFADPRTFVQAVSWRKAAAVAPGVAAGLVLAADTIAWLDGRPILKPADEADARRILRWMGGRTHELWTGVTLWRRPDDLQAIWQERSLVSVVPFGDAELDAYLATRSWRGHSGGYAIMEEGDPHVSVVEGSVSNVIGLPMETTLKVLQWFAGVSPRRPAGSG